MNNYKLIGRAGEGAHGFVFKGIDQRSDTLVALKKITFNPNLGVPKKTMREICSLRVLKSKNIVKLLEVTCMGSSAVLVMEYLPWSLSDVLNNQEIQLLLNQIKTYLRMILSGVAYMHENNIMHRDLKPANLLISNEGILKIADFGLARIYNSKKPRQYSHQVATRWYRAPELLYGSRNYTSSVDMWSVGCILAEMINKQPLFQGESDIEQLAIVLGTLGTPNNDIWPGFKQLPDYNKISFSPSRAKGWSIILPKADAITLNLVSKIIIYDGHRRITAKQVTSIGNLANRTCLSAYSNAFYAVARHSSSVPEEASLSRNHWVVLECLIILKCHGLLKDFLFEAPVPCKLSEMPQLEQILLEEDSIWNFAGFEECFSEISDNE